MLNVSRVQRLAAMALIADMDREVIERPLYRGPNLTKRQLRQRKEELATLGCIAQIAGKAKLEEDRGSNRAIVFRVTPFDYNRPDGNHQYNTCPTRWLKGVAKRVFDWCRQPDPYDRTFSLNPRLEFYHDGAGETWFNLVIAWN